jgi:hypothetical protein
MRLTVRDSTTAGHTLAALELQLDAERITVGELIRTRVHQEVRAHNARLTSGTARFTGLVQPEAAERKLNAGSRRPRTIDAARQTEVALRAFERGHVLLLVDDRQVEELDQEITLGPGSNVTFLKLVPLVGG